MRLLLVFLDIDNEPHGVMRLSSLLREHGHETKMVVASHEDPLEVALDWRPDVLGYSVYTGTHRDYLNLNYQIALATTWRAFRIWRTASHLLP